MNRDDIIRLVQEAGGIIEHIGTNIAWFEFLPKNLEHFANLIAAAERKRLEATAWGASKKWIVEAVAAEREACAKVCETHTVDDVLVGVGIAQSCAAVIRARGEK